jgi:hypothetical protein
LNTVEEITSDLDDERAEVGRTLLWRSKNGNCPLTVAGDLSVAPDGRRYVSVENTQTGIPADELEAL